MNELRRLLKELGTDYSIKTIDLEPCLYRDYGNGFDLEVSRAGRKRNKTVDMYLWHNKGARHIIVERRREVPKEDIHEVAEELRVLSEGIDIEEWIKRHF